nr:MAG: RNA-dependent RNA polymerase [Riboviria sp.]
MGRCNWDIHPLSYKQVVETYSGGKKKIYEAARLRVESGSFCKKWAKVRMFVKPDKYSTCKIKDKVPRAIQYRRPEYNLCIARFLRPIEKVLFNMQSKGRRWFAKGRSLQQRASDILYIYNSFDNPVIYNLDYAKFDSCVTIPHLKMLHKFYLSIFPSRTLYNLLQHQLHNVGFSQQGLRYSVDGTRMSGDYDTSLGNSLLNLLVILMLSEYHGVQIHAYIDGDDALLFTENTSKEITADMFRCYGLEAELERVDLAGLEFCQTKLIRSSPPTMARNPIKVISNLAVSINNFDRVTWPKIFKGKVVCEFWANQGVPYVCDYMKSLLDEKVTYRVPQEDARRWHMVKDHKKAVVTPQAYDDLYNAWGFGPLEAQLLFTPVAFANLSSD